MIYLLSMVVVLGVGYLVAVSLFQFFKDRKSSRRAQLSAKSKQLKVAENALRQISRNASGNPVLEAEIALDEIERLEIKEIS